MTGLAAAPASRHQEKIVAEFRASDGRADGYHAGLPLLLLTTTGARSGQRHATPLTYLPDGDRYVAAANTGAPASPAWYRHLVANRGVTVEVGPETFCGIAAVAVGEERRVLYERCATAYPQLARYQAMTTREIPIVVLSRQRDDQAPRDRD